MEKYILHLFNANRKHTNFLNIFFSFQSLNIMLLHLTESKFVKTQEPVSSLLNGNSKHAETQ